MNKAQFEFNQWREAFAAWNALTEEEKNEHVFVLDTNDFTSGYWIEKKPYLELKEDVAFHTDAEVQAFLQRIITEVEEAKIEGVSPKFTT